MAFEISLKTLIESGAHFGHQSKRWNPKMAPYLYGVKEGIHVFDLTKTKDCLDESLNVLKDASYAGKKILLVGTKKQIKEKVIEIAKEVGIFYISERWLGGTLTNFDQIKASTRRLNDLREGVSAGKFKGRTKKERLLIERDIARLERFFSGIEGMEAIPDIMFIVDVRREKTAVKEAQIKGVTTIGIDDSNSDPTVVDYPIPMNDDASRALEYVLDLVKDAILEGRGIKKTVRKVTKRVVKSKVKKGSSKKDTGSKNTQNAIK